MIIGGTSVVIGTGGDRFVLEAIRLIRTAWPKCVVLNSEGGCFDPQKPLSELLVYKDEAASIAWKQLGACAETGGTLIGIIPEQTSMTLVIDEPYGAEIDAIVTRVKYVAENMLLTLKTPPERYYPVCDVEKIMTGFFKVKRLDPKAQLPVYATEGSVGMDLFTNIEFPRTLRRGESALFSTGISIEIPDGFEGQIRPRSGLARKHGVTVLNAPGTIDSDYRGEIQVLLINHGAETVKIPPGHRIAQIVFAPVVIVALEETVDQLSPTERGAGGFGSTGSK